MIHYFKKMFRLCKLLSWNNFAANELLFSWQAISHLSVWPVRRSSWQATCLRSTWRCTWPSVGTSVASAASCLRLSGTYVSTWGHTPPTAHTTATSATRATRPRWVRVELDLGIKCTSHCLPLMVTTGAVCSNVLQKYTNESKHYGFTGPLSFQNALQVHQRTHGEDKPYVCPHCCRAFREKGALVRHIRHHTGEKPFKCSKCGRGFAEHGTLNRHLRSKGNNSYTHTHTFYCMHMSVSMYLSKQA